MSAEQPLPISPGATLDLFWDWSGWLVAGETITGRDVTVVPPLTKANDSVASGVVTAWVTVPTAINLGVSLLARCKVTTSHGRIDQRLYALQVVDR